jgi:hypothetical protein
MNYVALFCLILMVFLFIRCAIEEQVFNQCIDKNREVYQHCVLSDGIMCKEKNDIMVENCVDHR